MNPVSGTGWRSTAKNLISIFCSSIFTLRLRPRLSDGFNLHRVLNRTAQPVMTVMGGVDEELRFLQQLHRPVGVRRFAFPYELPRLEEVFGELSAGVFIPKKLPVVETPGELGDNFVFIFRDAWILAFDQSLGGMEHGNIGGLDRLLRPSTVEQQMRLEQLALAGGQGKFRLADHLAGALADAHVRQGKLPRVAPVGGIGAIHL